MKLTVSNYRRIERAVINISPIALVAGTNEAGKTCMAQAARAALTQNGAPHPNALKKDGALMVRRGAKGAEIVLAGKGGSVAVSFPKGTVSPSGDTPPQASVFAAGVACLIDLLSEKRALALGRYIDATPSESDLAPAMYEIGYGDSAVQQTWEAIQTSGWDEVRKQAASHATKLKGQWEQISGVKYGPQKAAGWLPEGWSDDIEGAVDEDLESAVDQAQASLEESIGQAAVSTAEVERWRAEADARPKKSVMDKACADVEAKEKEVAAAEAERNALPSVDGDDGSPCPACGVVLVVDQVWEGRPVLKEAEAIDASEVKARRAARAAADGKASKLRGELAPLQAKLREVEDAAKRAAVAEASLADMSEGGASQEDVASAREALASAQTRLSMFRARRDAARLHVQITRTLALVDILAPDGLRKSKIEAALEPFNADLAALCKAAGWRAVRLDENLDAHLGPDPFWLCSESAQFRVRATLQIAMARQDGSDLVVIDGADILDAKGRNGLFAMLAHAGTPALVAMTVNRSDLVPDLAAAGLGQSYWLSDGVAHTGVGKSDAAQHAAA